MRCSLCSSPFFNIAAKVRLPTFAPIREGGTGRHSQPCLRRYRSNRQAKGKCADGPSISRPQQILVVHSPGVEKCVCDIHSCQTAPHSPAGRHRLAGHKVHGLASADNGERMGVSIEARKRLAGSAGMAATPAREAHLPHHHRRKPAGIRPQRERTTWGQVRLGSNSAGRPPPLWRTRSSGPFSSSRRR